MKLQKLHLLTFLGLALWAPQNSLNAKIPAATANASWSNVVMGTVASFGTKSVKLPFKVLNLCYQHYLITLVGLGAAYLGYKRYVQPRWNARQERLAKEAPDHAEQVRALCQNPGAFQQLNPEAQADRENTLHNALVDHSFTERFCSWIPTKFHTWLHDKFGLTKGRSAHYFFETLKKTTQVRGKRTKAGLLDTSFETVRKYDPLTEQHHNILRVFNLSPDHAQVAAGESYNARAFNGATKGEPNGEFIYNLSQTKKA